MIPTTRIVHIYPMSCVHIILRRAVPFPSGYRLTPRSRSRLLSSLKARMANTAINTLRNSETNRYIQEALPEVGLEAYLIYGTLLLARLLLRHKACELLVRPRSRCDPTMLPDHSQVVVAERRLSRNPAQALALFLVRKLEAIKQLRLQILALWVLVIVYELVYKVGVVGEIVPRLALVPAAKALMVLRAEIRLTTTLKMDLSSPTSQPHSLGLQIHMFPVTVVVVVRIHTPANTIASVLKAQGKASSLGQ